MMQVMMIVKVDLNAITAPSNHSLGSSQFSDTTLSFLSIRPIRSDTGISSPLTTLYLLTRYGASPQVISNRLSDT